MKQIYKIILLVALIFLIGFSAGYFYCSYKERFVLLKNLDYLYPIRLNDSAYKFTNPLLAYMIPPADEDPRFQDLKDKISDLINAQKQNGLKRASVLLSDLNEGRWIGVNEDDEYSPASMFKVVIMIAYLKASEQVPGLLDRKLTYTKNLDDQLKTTPLDYKTSLQIGSSYTINELINKMIIVTAPHF
ncbi:MAG: serine hydrolase [Candidatus Staskawiczbacteria bacterium]|nr:serine hydrolase [Candidatus Staskawiczbacteria bacterium]